MAELAGRPGFVSQKLAPGSSRLEKMEDMGGGLCPGVGHQLRQNNNDL